MLAPTGSGKTLAAFLWCLDRLAREPGEGTRVVYVSPIKALAYDVERNLRAPLAGLQRLGAGGSIVVDVRTGDTPQSERERQRKHPGQILITTPESLYLVLAGRSRERLRAVDTIIVDEIHALAPTKRGIHLALSLERLAHLVTSSGQSRAAAHWAFGHPASTYRSRSISGRGPAGRGDRRQRAAGARSRARRARA